MKNRKRKRIINSFMVALIVCLGLGLCVSIADAAEKGPIKIGFLSPLTGNFAQIGMDMMSGAKMFLEENNYTVAGRKIEVIWEDEGPGPDTAITKTRKLIKHDKVQLIVGVFMTASGYAVASICSELEIPLVITYSGGDDLTQRKTSKWVNRVASTGCIHGHVGGEYAYKDLGWRKVVTFGMDYGAGHENVGGFQAVFEALGGKVIQKMWCPMTTMDFGPYIANFDREADGLWEIISGAMSIRFLKSLRESGIMDKMGVAGLGTITDETLLEALGDTALGVITAWDYTVVLDNPKNNQFRELTRKKLGKEVTTGIQKSWNGFEWVFQAIKDIKGDVENKDKFVKKLRTTEIKDSIHGPLSMDEYGNLVADWYIRRVDKVGTAWGGYQNTLIKTIPRPGQFWKWNPKEFMSRPVYSRDYPPCKFCK